ncbi:MAG: acyltransferase [Chthoniobacteraceae bacterium]
MNPATSAFLDLLRIIAALLVFINHDVQFWNRRIWSIANPLAHSAVIIFFVLSGYVIAYSTFARNQDARKFVVARLSRLYSVVLPALLLTFVLQRIGASLNAEYYQQYSRGAELPRYLITAAFLQNIWLLAASPASNKVFWSLSYEFWYYALFGVAVFLKSKRVRNVALVAILSLITPEIVLLLPCWLTGVVAYVCNERFCLSSRGARCGFILCFVATILIFAYLPEYPFPLGHPRLWFSSCFVSDWIAAVAVAATILMFVAAKFAAPSPRTAAVIRYGAAHTFSLYLYHYPLLVFANAILPLGSDPLRQGLCAVGVLATVLLLSTITEARRNAWRKCFEWAYDRIFFREAGGKRHVQGPESPG